MTFDINTIIQAYLSVTVFGLQCLPEKIVRHNVWSIWSNANFTLNFELHAGAVQTMYREIVLLLLAPCIKTDLKGIQKHSPYSQLQRN